MWSGMFRLYADAVALVHVVSVLFVLLGGLLVLRWPRLVGLHVPAVAWGVLVEYSDSICPLTPVDNYRCSMELASEGTRRPPREI